MDAVSVEDRAADAARSYKQWTRLSLEVLRLRCNMYHLNAKGKKIDLAKRLTDHFLKEKTEEESSSGGEESEQQDEPARKEDDVLSLLSEPNEEDTVPWADEGALEYINNAPGRRIETSPVRTPRSEVSQSLPITPSREIRNNTRYTSRSSRSSRSRSTQRSSSSPSSSSENSRRSRSRSPPRRSRREHRASTRARPSTRDLMRKVLKEVEGQTEVIKKYENQHREAEAEIGALRNQLLALQKHPVSPTPRDVSPPPLPSRVRRTRSASTHTSVNKHRKVSREEKHDNKKRVRSSVVKMNEGKNSYSSPSFSQSFSKMAAKGAVDPLNLNYNKKSKMAAVYHLPPIKKDLLKAIRKREFCCFDKLKPKKLYLRSQDEQLGLEKIDLRFDIKKKKLEVSKRKSEGVQNFAEWMEVWNLFTQGHLHYFPEDAEVLFAYQKAITRFSARFTFEAVYSYDIDFRNLISIEKRLPQEQRQVEWGKVNDELVHIHLRENRRPEPTCFKCKEKGHYSNKCPYDVSGNSRTVSYPPPQPLPPVQSLMSRNVSRPWQSTGGDARRMLPSRLGGAGNNSTNNNNNSGNNRTAKYCKHFRLNMSCPYAPGCIFRHDCERCGETGHNGNSCFMYTSAPFRGPQGP